MYLRQLKLGKEMFTFFLKWVFQGIRQKESSKHTIRINQFLKKGIFDFFFNDNFPELEKCSMRILDHVDNIFLNTKFQELSKKTN